ncbi:hypothetical protein FKP32DRAFT_1551893, partial [Trametes sanguinea]
MLPTSLAGLPEHIPRPAPTGHAATAPIATAEVTVLDIAVTASSAESPGVEAFIPPSTPTDTKPNRFGVFRRFFIPPQHDPEEDLTLDSFTDPHSNIRLHPSPSRRTPLHGFGRQMLQAVQTKASTLFAPFANVTVFRIMHWLYSGSPTKSAYELNRLVRETFLAPEFRIEHLTDFDATRENERLDAFSSKPDAFSTSDGWRQGSVSISLPKERVRHPREEDAPVLEVDKIYHRSLLELLKAACQDASAKAFHWMPFNLFHRQSASAEEERLFGDAYTADAMNEEHERLQVKACEDQEPGDPADLEYVIVPIMISSDSTHLTNFGQASLWPIYVAFANLSKYVRACPTAFAMHHLAYIPSLPLSVQTSYQEAYGEPASAAVLRFCKRELMQKIWLLLLDDDFIHAYAHGIVITSKVHLMGSSNDMRTRTIHPRSDTGPLQADIAAARRNIFCFGAPPEGSTVEGILGSTSTTPTRSAFSTRLAQFGFQVYQLLVPDLLHEFELGVWKATITHIVRILIAAGGRSIQEFDARFSHIPTFGRNTIRSFGHNASGFKKLAARDYEDLLQCAFPVLEGLLPTRLNEILLDTIFLLATWHALAKLRLHSETSLSLLEGTATTLGRQMRLFLRDVCSSYDTRELPKETTARARRKAATQAKSSSVAGTSRAPVLPALSVKRKTLNLSTYKFHRLADYPRCIRRWGTTDNYTTQTSELEHRRVKRFYARTNKNTDFAWQIARHQRREAILNRISRHTLHRQARTAQKPSGSRGQRQRRGPNALAQVPCAPLQPLHLRFEQSEPLPACSPKDHTQISEEQANPVNIHQYVAENDDDPAFKGFVQKLQVHVFKRLLEAQTGSLPDGQVSREDLRRLRIQRNRMYLHKVMRVNYTSYDMRREQDSVNPRSHPDIMLLAPEEDSDPYLYARVISIFHVNAFLVTPALEEEPEPQLIHILWVRWFELDTLIPAGLAARRPPRLRFAGLEDDPFTFIAPTQVLRGVHILPAFHYGRSDVALPYPSITRGDIEDEDYAFYYVGIWSDRDLFMRHLGGGIGHKQARMSASSAAGTISRLSPNVEDINPEDADAEMTTVHAAVPMTASDSDGEEGYSSSEEDPERAYYPSTDEGSDQDDDEATHWQVGDAQPQAAAGLEEGD